MSLGQGATSKAAFKIEKTAWGTSTDCGTGNQIHFISESISHAIEQAQAIHLDGTIGAKSLYPIFKKYGGDLLVEAHYAGMETLIACAMGMSHQDLSPVSTSTSANEHFFEPSEDMSVRAFNGYEMTTPSGNVYRKGTLCLEKDVSIWELASSMCNAMSFEASPERVTFSFTFAGRTITLDSATNSSSAAWTLPSNTEQITWDDLTFYIKARDEFTITSANDNFIVDEGGGDVTIDIADGTYTGYELAQLIARGLRNMSPTLSGQYEMEYDEHRKRFKIYTTDAQTFSVTGTDMDMASTVGMTIASASATYAESNFDAIPDAYAAFTTTDEVGISKFTFALENNLDIESQDSESELYILEPERNGVRRVTGTIEIPRYKNDTWLKAVNGYTTYMIHAKFAGSAIDSETYELNLYFPAVKFSNAEAPITGAELIKQTLAFEAEVPDIVDFVNFGLGTYTFKTTPSTGQTLYSGSAYTDGLYLGGGSGIIFKWNGSSFATSTDVGTANTMSIQQFNSKLYAGGNGGEIYTFNGNVWTTSTDVGSGDIIDIIQYGDDIFALEGATGKVFKSSAPVTDCSWSTACDTTATNADRLAVYNGSLYMIGGDGSTFTKVYKSTNPGTGTDWSVSCDFADATGVNSLAVHAGKLYASSGSDLYVYPNGSTAVDWEVEKSGVGFSIRDMISYKGNLLLAENGTTKDLYYYDFGSNTAVNIYTGLNLNATQKMITYQGRLFIMPGQQTLRILDPIKELMITIQNQNSYNPFDPLIGA